MHSSDPNFWGGIIALVVSLFLAALASSAETAFTSVSRIKIKNLAEHGNARAQQIEKLLAEPNRFLSTILVINSVAVIVASSAATGITVQLWPSYAEVISAVLVSIVVLIFCEITPKTAVVQNPERVALAQVGLLSATVFLLTPVIVALTSLTSVLVKLLGGQVRRKGPFITEAELRMLVAVGEEEGVLEEEEKDMIHSIFELADTTVHEVMVPRIDIISIPVTATLDQAIDLALQGGQSRIPVYDGTIDNIVGVVYAKDLLRVLRVGNKQVSLRDIARPAYFVPESKKLDDLLHEMRQQKIHMAIIVDEYGAIAGLVTIEDLVEEIIGDIQDEYDREELLYERVGENEYIIDAKISIDDFNEIMDTEIEAEDFDTLGGFVYSQLDKVPSVGDQVQYDGLDITVLSTKGRRITKVKIVQHETVNNEEIPEEATPSHHEKHAGKREYSNSAGDYEENE